MRRLYYWWLYQRPAPIHRLRVFWQRGRRGWADSDTWGFDNYLAGILAGGLLHLAETTYGHPCRGAPPQDCQECQCEKLWDTELRENAERFQRMAEDDWSTVKELDALQEATSKALEWLKVWFNALWS